MATTTTTVAVKTYILPRRIRLFSSPLPSTRIGKKKLSSYANRTYYIIIYTRVIRDTCKCIIYARYYIFCIPFGVVKSRRDDGYRYFFFSYEPEISTFRIKMYNHKKIDEETSIYSNILWSN